RRVKSEKAARQRRARSGTVAAPILRCFLRMPRKSRCACSTRWARVNSNALRYLSIRMKSGMGICRVWGLATCMAIGCEKRKGHGFSPLVTERVAGKAGRKGEDHVVHVGVADGAVDLG